MTEVEERLCKYLLQEHFGELVCRVGTELVHAGSLYLRQLVTRIGLSSSQVRKALCVLIQHSMVTFVAKERGPVLYESVRTALLRIPRYSRYIYVAKTLYGDTGELLLEEILQHGELTMSDAIRRVADRLTETSNEGCDVQYSEVAKTFCDLVNTHFLQKCPQVIVPAVGTAVQATAPTLELEEREAYTIPTIPLTGRGKRRHLSLDHDEEQPLVKKAKKSMEEIPPDDGIYWHVNFERFHQFFRDQAIVSAVASKLDKTAGEIVRTMLRLSELTTTGNAAVTQPISSLEILHALPMENQMTKPVLDQYLSLLVDDSMEVMSKYSESSGGSYVVNLHRCLHTLAQCSLVSIVQERFGSRPARIFRLLLSKRHLEQKQVEDFAMIPSKEAKEMLYTMLSENFISLQELPKTPDFAPARTFYLYTVKVQSTARMTLQRCYKTLTNLIFWRHHETQEHKRLFEKSQRIEAIVASVQASGADKSQLQEIEEMITAPEQQQLDHLKASIKRMDHAELQVDETILLLESFLLTTHK
uniref:DNA-directed RNA polymerase III subunit RPC3 isoform X1 n=1 Tax=Myxine glutinosa TaxID=7769 RepID=UPI0035901CF3